MSGLRSAAARFGPRRRGGPLPAPPRLVVGGLRPSSSAQQLQQGPSPFDAPHLAPRKGLNLVALSPVSLIKHAALVYPDHLCYVAGAGVVPEDKTVRRSWSQVHERACRVAHSLRTKWNVRKNDVVSVIAPNTQHIYELHFAVPGAQAVLHTINTRLDAKSIAFQLQHAETKVLFVDGEFAPLIRQALELMPAGRPVVVDMHDDTAAAHQGHGGVGVGVVEYEALAAATTAGDAPALLLPDDEWDAIALSYTSGTTGSPKGVVTHHRGAYLNAVQNLVQQSLARHAKFLWVVPLFHCNGWSYAWSLAANAGCSFFMRQVRPEPLFHILETFKINLFCGAPITMLTMLQHQDKHQEDKARYYFSHSISLITAGAPPPPSLMARFQDRFNIKVQTAYGLTESYGPISSGPLLETVDQTCIYQSKAALMEDLAVVAEDADHAPVPVDGKSRGEVVLRGNILMKGYFKNAAATEAEFSARGNCFLTGDVGVWHQPGHRVEIKDRSKDVIISGGENVNSAEVEDQLLMHPAVLEVAVVAQPDEKWGEVPAAFVVLREGQTSGDASSLPSALMSWARSRMAGFASPKAVYIVPSSEGLPKTSTGKVQKNVLRERAASAAAAKR